MVIQPVNRGAAPLPEEPESVGAGKLTPEQIAKLVFKNTPEQRL